MQVDINKKKALQGDTFSQPKIEEAKLKHAPRSLIDETLNSGLFTIKKQESGVKSLNAKKIDIDFGDNEDFFNSFEPTKNKTEVSQPQNKYVTKLAETEDPFNLFGSAPVVTVGKQHSFVSQDSASTTQSSGSSLDAQEKLRSMGNRKGISSEELFGNQYEKTAEVQAKYTQLTGAKAISSDMFFGSGDGSSNEGAHTESGGISS